MSDPRKQSLLLSGEMVEELRAESLRTGISMSQLAQDAWRIARGRLVLLRQPVPEPIVKPFPSLVSAVLAARRER